MAKAYIDFLYSDEGQDIIGKHGYRPAKDEFKKKYAASLPELPLFTLAQVAGSWSEAQSRFFNEGGIFDKIRSK